MAWVSLRTKIYSIGIALVLLQIRHAVNPDVQYVGMIEASESEPPLLDFAIIGHPKTATTFMLQWLQLHKDIYTVTNETSALSKGRPEDLIQQLSHLPGRAGSIHGYKYPRDIRSMTALQTIGTRWPSANLIVGIRHPILWFESFYNFRLRHNISMLDPHLLMSECISGSDGVCVDEARFHVHLSYLGKTAMNDDETKLLEGHERQTLTHLNRDSSVPNKVFLYELGQLYDSDLERKETFRKDIENFLGVSSPLPSLPVSHHSKNYKFKLDICDDEYDDVRAALIKVARPASTWIRDFFLASPDVFVSSPEYLDELLQSWMKDPCVSGPR